MKDVVDISDGPDAIDHLVELLLKDPSRADQIKSVFRERLADESPSGVTTLHATRREADVEAEEFWDNFPI